MSSKRAAGAAIRQDQKRTSAPSTLLALKANRHKGTVNLFNLVEERTTPASDFRMLEKECMKTLGHSDPYLSRTTAAYWRAAKGTWLTCLSIVRWMYSNME